MTAAHAVLRSLRSLRTARAGRAGCPDAVKTARTPFRKVCSFQLTEVCSFQLPLTTAPPVCLGTGAVDEAWKRAGLE